MRASGFPGFKKPKTSNSSSSPAIARISIQNNGLDLIDDHHDDDDIYATEKALTVGEPKTWIVVEKDVLSNADSALFMW